LVSGGTELKHQATRPAVLTARALGHAEVSVLHGLENALLRTLLDLVAPPRDQLHNAAAP
jgi:hypothetical protein